MYVVNSVQIQERIEFESYCEMIIQDGDKQLNNVFLKVRPVLRYILYKY